MIVADVGLPPRGTGPVRWSLDDPAGAFRSLFGANLRRARLTAGLSQEQLMFRSDVHRTQISRYERGETEPTAEVIVRLARALHVDADEFFSGVELAAAPTEADRQTESRRQR